MGRGGPKSTCRLQEQLDTWYLKRGKDQEEQDAESKWGNRSLRDDREKINTLPLESRDG